MVDPGRCALSKNEVVYIKDMDELRTIRQEKLEELQENTCETELCVL
jgi:hypothetical protein